MALTRLAQSNEVCRHALKSLQHYVDWHLGRDSTMLSLEEETNGKFNTLPFLKWLLSNKALPSGIEGQCMPVALIELLTGPDQSLPSTIPPFQRWSPLWGKEYKMMKRVTLKQMGDRVLAAKAVKGGIALYIHHLLNRYLCSPNELISTFAHPKHAELSEEGKLAVGIMRECLLIPRFRSMYEFWMKHGKMIDAGGKFMGYYQPSPFDTTVILDLIQDDPSATAMYKLCLDLGMPRTNFDFALTDFCYVVE